MTPSHPQFGLLVAYLLPGFIGLGGVAPLVPTVAKWLRPVVGQDGLGLGPPVYAVLAATATGMVLSCFRWLVVDHALHLAGAVPPVWDAGRLEGRLDAFNYLVEHHYRYYQFYANTLVAILWTYALNRWTEASPILGSLTDLAVLIICGALLAGSYDSLSKYYDRTRQLVGQTRPEQKAGNTMTNGCHRDQSPAPVQTKPSEATPQVRAETQKPETQKDARQNPNK